MARAWLLPLLVAIGCGSSSAEGTDASTGSQMGSGSSETSSAATTSTDASEAGTNADGSTGAAQCSRLYGRPNENSGLGPDQCGPTCACEGDWVAPEYTAEDIAALRALELTTPFEDLTADPYETPEDFPLDDDSVCGVLVDGTSYGLQTFDDDEAAEAAGAKVTHDGACGLCSPLQDLAAYMDNGDLTEPVRACGVLGLSEGDEAQFECLLELGFTEPCARIWGYNTTHTRTVCLQVCLDLLDAPYHEDDGSLNECLQCDEDLSGPVFKAVAGRTRRNTGLASALCRPCDEVRQVVHRYE